MDELAIQPLLPARLNRRGPGLAVGDVNGDGVDDLVIGGTTATPLAVLLGSRSGCYARMDTAVLFPPGPVNDGPVLLFDAAGDGRTALLVTKGGNSLPAGAAEYQPQLFLNVGHGGFRPAPPDALPPLPIAGG